VHLIDLTGQRFDRLVVLRRGPRRATSTAAVWICRCDCGREHAVIGSALTHGSTKSCGCLKQDAYVVGTNRTHGGTGTVEYNAWENAKRRCYDPKATNYERYGGRGITMFLAWLNNFAAFLAYLGPKPSPRHTLDRIDSNGNYEPGNVRWALPKQQNNNLRSNQRLVLGGQSRTLAEWSEVQGLPRSTLVMRLRRGWSVVRALNTPGGHRRRASVHRLNH
jgi:hypothetical protein